MDLEEVQLVLYAKRVMHLQPSLDWLAVVMAGTLIPSQVLTGMLHTALSNSLVCSSLSWVAYTQKYNGFSDTEVFVQKFVLYFKILIMFKHMRSINFKPISINLSDIPLVNQYKEKDTHTYIYISNLICEIFFRKG